MKPQINMIGIITLNFQAMLDFYKDVMGFTIKLQMDHFVEFNHEGVRFAISTQQVMASATGEESFKQQKSMIRMNKCTSLN